MDNNRVLFKHIKQAQLYLAVRKGYDSYEEQIISEHKEREEKKEEYRRHSKFASFIVARLNFIGQNNSWLAQQIGVTNSAIYNYTHNRCFPSERVLKEMARTFGVQLKTLEQLITS